MRCVFVAAIVLAALVAQTSAASWNVTNWNFATIAFGCAFTSETDGLAPISNNGQGSFILQTTDGGNSWNAVPNNVTALLLMGVAADGTTAVVGDMFGIEYSSQPTGYSFKAAKLSGGLTTQDIQLVQDGGYAAAGNTILGGNGVAVSKDSTGSAFKFFNISALKTSARYGSYPSSKVWYVAAGEWPNNKFESDIEDEFEEENIVREVSSRIALHVDPENDFALTPIYRRTVGDNTTSWKAQIVKTTDGGKTWTSQFYDENNFYFNQISCFDEDNCAVVGEADTSAQPGVRVYVTADGGNTWTRTLYNATSTYSIMAVNYIAKGEIWAAGGNLDQSNFQGFFWHSLDAGNTWSTTTVAGVYANDMSFVSSTQGFATAFNYASVSSFMVFN